MTDAERVKRLLEAFGIRGRAADIYRPDALRAEGGKPHEFRVAGLIVADEAALFVGETRGIVTSGAMHDWLTGQHGDVRILINSPGGDVFAGVEMHSLLRRYDRGRVAVEVTGIAASAASIVAMAGDDVEMRTGTELMIHRAWTIAIGSCTELRDAADVLDRLDGDIADIYTARTGMPRDDVLARLERETWMSAAEAVEHGFADCVLTDAADGDDEADEDTVMAAVTAVREMNAQLVGRRLAALGDHHAV